MKLRAPFVVALFVVLLANEVNCAFLKSLYMADLKLGETHTSTELPLIRSRTRKRFDGEGRKAERFDSMWRDEIVSRSKNSNSRTDEMICREKRMGSRSLNGRKYPRRASRCGSGCRLPTIRTWKKDANVKRATRNRKLPQKNVIRLKRREERRATHSLRIKNQNFRSRSKTRRSKSLKRSDQDYMERLHFQSRELALGYGLSKQQEHRLDGDLRRRRIEELRVRTRKPVAVREQLPKEPEQQALLHIEYTTEFPKWCSCKIMNDFEPETCWRFYGKGTKCEKYECKPNWVCVDGMETASTCVRRIVRSKVVPNNDGTCRRERIEDDYIYVPYKQLAQ